MIPFVPDPAWFDHRWYGCAGKERVVAGGNTRVMSWRAMVVAAAAFAIDHIVTMPDQSLFRSG